MVCQTLSNIAETLSLEITGLFKEKTSAQVACMILTCAFFLQVTFDVAWSPACIDRRCYNYTGIADACDFLFVMSYDEQSQIWTDCIAKANAPYLQTLAGEDKTLSGESGHFHLFT